MRSIRSVAVAALLAVLLAPQLPAAERSEIPDQYKWNLADLYPNEAAWIAAKQDLATAIPKLGQWQGRLGESAATLLAAMTDWDADQHQDRSVSTVYAFQSIRPGHGESSRSTADEAGGEPGLHRTCSTATAFVKPELISIGQREDRWLHRGGAEARPVSDVLRRHAASGRAHAVDERGEDRRTHGADVADTGRTVYSAFTGAEMPFPEITLSNGEKVRIDGAAYIEYRDSTGQRPTATRCSRRSSGTLDALPGCPRRTSHTATADYTIFVAEVASTLNENLLFHHMLDQTKDDDTQALPAVELPRHDAPRRSSARRCSRSSSS